MSGKRNGIFRRHFGMTGRRMFGSIAGGEDVAKAVKKRSREVTVIKQKLSRMGYKNIFVILIKRSTKRKKKN